MLKYKKLSAGLLALTMIMTLGSPSGNLKAKENVAIHDGIAAEEAIDVNIENAFGTSITEGSVILPIQGDSANMEADVTPVVTDSGVVIDGPDSSDHATGYIDDGTRADYYIPNGQQSYPSEAQFFSVEPSYLQGSSQGTYYNAMENNLSTGAKNQGTFDTCWAFTAMATAESSMLKSGLASKLGFNVSTLDLSEAQFAYFMFDHGNDPLGNLSGDSNKNLTGQSYLNVGGNNLMNMFQLATWRGAALESKASYSEAAASNGTAKLSESLAFDDVAHLQGAYRVNMSNSDDIKYLIKNYGAVATGIHAAYIGGSNSFTVFAQRDSHGACGAMYSGVTPSNPETSATKSDHAVVIIGWDDNYSRANFKTGNQPSANGAWLVKNSWGTSDYAYFWISYADRTFADEDAYAYSYESANNYSYNYQYDGSASSAVLNISNGCYVANVFTVNGSANERLDAVSFALNDSNVNYSIQIYKNPSAGNPTSGEALLQTPQTGTTSYNGYYTVKLNEPQVLSKGNRFAVVINFTHNDGSAVSMYIDSFAGGGVSGKLQYVNSGAVGQSYYGKKATTVGVKDSVTDLYAYYTGGKLAGTPRIKAFTTVVAGGSGSSGGTSGGGTSTGVIVPAVKVSYETHVQSYGWEADVNNSSLWKSDGQMSGTSGQAKRLEAIRIKVSGNPNLGISYRTHVQSYGWERNSDGSAKWKSNGDMSGTSGQAKRLEAIQIKLTGSDAGLYDVYYRVHAQTYGWLGWAKNGQSAGTASQAKRLEGIQIVVIPKGTLGSGQTPSDAWTASNGKSSSGILPYATAQPCFIEVGKYAANTDNAGMINYMTHVQTYGNQSYVSDGAVSGTFGESKRLEGIRIKLNTVKTGVAGGICYTTHVQTYGWQGNLNNPATWRRDGQLSGTSGEAKRLEAICIKLTGDMQNEYDVYYRVHAQTYGWLGWAKNGQPAGTSGMSKRLEAIQIVLVPKRADGSSLAPGSTAGAYICK